ncbi:hypothetical protein [Gynuella sunshinyii]|uniref:hypothetical protein n=1 Tax=Gynuella sunshinyii TaxID=1445505 RepID=UPI001184B50F|nr:hypothetical protein [Gynuella sunshinyii]
MFASKLNLFTGSQYLSSVMRLVLSARFGLSVASLNTFLALNASRSVRSFWRSYHSQVHRVGPVALWLCAFARQSRSVYFVFGFACSGLVLLCRAARKSGSVLNKYLTNNKALLSQPLAAGTAQCVVRPKARR